MRSYQHRPIHRLFENMVLEWVLKEFSKLPLPMRQLYSAIHLFIPRYFMFFPVLGMLALFGLTNR
ncbi:MAG: hypothetical protein M3Q97_07175, partial [Bacteroidota bacterium]|nr:hypothetical protein [Bacteroidota bacterium]